MPRIASFLVVIALATALVVPAAALASETKVGKVRGRVVDINDARITSADVLIVGSGANRGSNWRLKTNDAGEFEASLPAGEYQFSIQANGFRRFSSKPFVVKAARTESFNIQMQVAPVIDTVPANSNPPQ
ncbi:MAG TPA: carboxypeptidase-like regulatory domain-containing protein [Pyrinomonadaceae bacterium]|nr:carboxypeptidase-like regulatory domain-containing protein [Pyrinomonadaceae bacterium]